MRTRRRGTRWTPSMWSVEFLEKVFGFYVWDRISEALLVSRARYHDRYVVVLVLVGGAYVLVCTMILPVTHYVGNPSWIHVHGAVYFLRAVIMMIGNI